MRLSVKIAFVAFLLLAAFQAYSNLGTLLVFPRQRPDPHNNMTLVTLKTQGGNYVFTLPHQTANPRPRPAAQSDMGSSPSQAPGAEELTTHFSVPGHGRKPGSTQKQDGPRSPASPVPEYKTVPASGKKTLAQSAVPEAGPGDLSVKRTVSPPWKDGAADQSPSAGLFVNRGGQGSQGVIVRDSQKVLLSSVPGKVRLPVVRSGRPGQETLPPCPATPPALMGAVQPVTGLQNVHSVQQTSGWLEQGGSYHPQHCRAAHRTAILIPYRNRLTHLHVLLANLLPFLHRQQADFTVFVIEQEPPSTFNRALLLNVGVLEASLRDLYTCFIFHDVDLIPLNDRLLYRCREQPKHFAVGINKFGYRLPYRGYFGGVAGLSREQVEKINGNSNLYFGWGGEDDELMYRVKTKGMKIVRDPIQISRYDMFKHTRDHGNEANPVRFQMLQSTGKRIDVDGLNSLKYNVTSVDVLPLYTWIKVKVDPHQLAQRNPQGPPK